MSRFPRVLGLCQDNLPEIAAAANACQEQLLYDKAAGEESWQGTWAEIRFNVSRTQPYITLPREIARLESATVCNKAVSIGNQFVEYLRFGNGRMSGNRCGCGEELEVFARNNAVLFTDLGNAPQFITIYATAEDVGKRVLLSGLDNNGNTIFSQDGPNRVQGIFVSLDSPFVTTTIQFNRITGIQKDQTFNPIQIYQTDPTTADQVLLLTMEPSELTASYRRYYFAGLPTGCCPPNATAGTVQVTAIAKLELIPVQVDTDYLLLQSREALIEEAQALRLREADTISAQQMSVAHHQKAIRLLISQVGHYNGINEPALIFAPFGSNDQMVGTLR